MDLGAGENGCIAGEQPSVSLRDCTDGGFVNFTCESDGAVSD